MSTQSAPPPTSTAHVTISNTLTIPLNQQSFLALEPMIGVDRSRDEDQS
jgi:hypothetical protein